MKYTPPSVTEAQEGLSPENAKLITKGPFGAASTAMGLGLVAWDLFPLTIAVDLSVRAALNMFVSLTLQSYRYEGFFLPGIP